MTTIEAREVSQQRGIRGVIRRHPLLSFFTLANAMSWIAWVPYILSNNGLGVWDYTFELGQLTGMLPGAYLGPLGAAFIVTLTTGGRAGLRTWVGRLWRWRVGLRWYLIALLGVPAALIVVGLVASGGEIFAPTLTTIAAYVPMLIIQMLTTGLAEEPGWRDFALPRLQAKFGPLKSAAILGPLWALWHMPLFFTEWGGWGVSDWTRPVFFTLFCIGFNVVMAWVFNSTGQSLPLAMLAHVSVNNFISVVYTDMFPSVDEAMLSPILAFGGLIAGAAVIVFTRGRLGYRGTQLTDAEQGKAGTRELVGAAS